LREREKGGSPVHNRRVEPGWGGKQREGVEKRRRGRMLAVHPANTTEKRG